MQPQLRREPAGMIRGAQDRPAFLERGADIPPQESVTTEPRGREREHTAPTACGLLKQLLHLSPFRAPPNAGVFP